MQYYTRSGITVDNVSQFQRIRPSERREYTRKGIKMARDWQSLRDQSLRDFVKARRRKAGLTQVALAVKAGVGLRFVRDLEQGKQALRMDVVNRILRLFGACLGPVGLPRE